VPMGASQRTDGCAMARTLRHQGIDFGVRGEPAGGMARVNQFAKHEDVELSAAARFDLDVDDAAIDQSLPHTEGVGLIPSLTAIFDANLHAEPRLQCGKASNFHSASIG